MEDGDLFIMDYAPDFWYYMSDLTRTWPVNGRFSGWQRELYGFYVKCYQAILKAIRPHETAAVIIKDAVAEMEKALAETKFSKDLYEKAARNFVGRFARAEIASDFLPITIDAVEKLMEEEGLLQKYPRIK